MTRFFIAHLKIHHRFLWVDFYMMTQGSWLSSFFCKVLDAPSIQLASHPVERESERVEHCAWETFMGQAYKCVCYIISTTSHWSERNQMATPNCKRVWEMKCSVLGKKKRNRCYWAQVASTLTFSPSWLNLILNAVISHPPPSHGSVLSGDVSSTKRMISYVIVTAVSPACDRP